jgi:hypothetical protein
MVRLYLSVILVCALLVPVFSLAQDAQASTHCGNATTDGYRVVGLRIYRGASCSEARAVVLRSQGGTAHYHGVWWSCYSKRGGIVCRGSLTGNSGTWGYGLFTVRDVYPVD